MEPGYSPLDGAASLAYVDVLDNALAKEIETGEGFSFYSAKKSTSAQTYWYLQHTLPKPKKNYYLGAETPELLERIAQQRHRWSEGKVDSAVLERQVAVALASGCVGITYQAYRVMNAAAQSGLFRAGGVIVGSYAYLAMGNMLGVSWRRDTTTTQDIDLAGSPDCMVALPDDAEPLRDTILASDDTLLEVPMFNRKDPSTGFHVRGKDFRVDLITPATGTGTGVKYVGPIKSYAQQVRFLDYILEDTQKAVLLHKAGIVVNVPSPARFALHKLIVAQRRPAAMDAKSRKDVQQASQLIAVLIEQRPGDLWLALDAAKAYPAKKFVAQLKAGFKKLPPELREPLQAQL
ncbi:MAG: nucleotidyltransferase domain-containing protein [Pseudomonadota bacterium]